MPFTVLVNLVVQGRANNLAQATGGLNAFNQQLAGMNRNLSLWTTMRVGEEMRRGGDRVVGWFGKAIQSAANLETSFLTLKHVTEQSASEVARVGKEIQRLAIILPQTQDQLFQISVNATRAGESFNNLTESTKQFAMFGIATQQEMTIPLIRSLLRFKTVMGDTNKEFADNLVALALVGNTAVGGIEYIERAGQRAIATARTVGVSTAQMTVFLASLSKALPGDRQAGNVLAGIFGEIAQPARFAGMAKIMEKTGAAVGTTAEEIRTLMNDVEGGGPAKFMFSFFEALSKLDFVSQQAALRTAGLTQKELRSAYAQLIEDGPELQRQFGLIGDKIKDNDKLTKDFDENLKSFNGTLFLIKGQLEKIATDAGQEFLGLAHSMLNVVSSLAEKWEAWDSPLKKVASALLLFVGIGGAVIGRIIEITALYGLARFALANTLFSSGMTHITLANTGLIRGSLLLIRQEIGNLVRAMFSWRTSAATAVHGPGGINSSIRSVGVTAGTVMTGIGVKFTALSAVMTGGISLLVIGLIAAFSRIGDAAGVNFSLIGDGIVTFIASTLVKVYGIVELIARVIGDQIKIAANAFIWVARLFGSDAKYFDLHSIAPKGALEMDNKLWEGFANRYSESAHPPLQLHPTVQAQLDAQKTAPAGAKPPPASIVSPWAGMTMTEVGAAMRKLDAERAAQTKVSAAAQPAVRIATTVKIDGEAVGAAVTKHVARGQNRNFGALEDGYLRGGSSVNVAHDGAATR